MEMQAAINAVEGHLARQAISRGAPANIKVSLLLWRNDTFGPRVAEVSFWVPREDDPRLGGGSVFMQSDPECLGVCAAAERVLIELICNGETNEISDAFWRLDELVWGDTEAGTV